MWRGVAEREPVSGQLVPVDEVEVDGRGGGEDEDGAAGRNDVERRRRGAEDRGVDRAVGRATGTLRPCVGGVDVVAPCTQHRCEEPADESLADDEHAASRHAFGAPEHAGERLEVGADCVADGIRQLEPVGGLDLLGEASRDDRRRGEARRRSTHGLRGSARTRRREGGGSARRARRPPAARRPRGRAPSRPARRRSSRRPSRRARRRARASARPARARPRGGAVRLRRARPRARPHRMDSLAVR